MSKNRVKVELSVKSISETIKKFQFYKKQIRKGDMVNDFLELVCEWIIKRANFYLNASDIGELVKIDIRNAWSYVVEDGKAKIINNANKIRSTQDESGSTQEIVPLAVLVEFGVGVVGESNPHPNAAEANYKYNLPPRKYVNKDGDITATKDDSGMWYFWTNSNELDIRQSAIVDITSFNDYDRNGKYVLRGRGGEQGKRIVVGTMGSEGVMYAYKAIADARIDLLNPNGEIATMWNKIQQEYIERYIV